MARTIDVEICTINGDEFISNKFALIILNYANRLNKLNKLQVTGHIFDD